MDQDNLLGESLLRAWLELAATIGSREMVSGMTYNEAVVCNHLSHRMKTAPDRPITATELCEKLKIRKSQMNQILTSLENQGYLIRTRNDQDRRQVKLMLTSAGQEAYNAAHNGARELLRAVVARLGDDATQDVIRIFELANATVEEILSTRRQKGTT